jgi:putative transposase
VAAVVEQELLYGEQVRRMYFLHAWVIMPDCVHAVMETRVGVGEIDCWFRRSTVRAAIRLLDGPEERFWEAESRVRPIRTEGEFENAIAFIEGSPVNAGLVARREEWPWSSDRAWQASGLSPA